MNSVSGSQSNNEDLYQTAEEKFRNSIEGCIINYIKEEGPKTVEELIQHTSEKFNSLRNPKGGKYKKDAATLIQTTLSKRKVFLKDEQGKWTLNDEFVFKYEAEQVKLISQGIKQRKEKHQSVMNLLSTESTVNFFERTVEQDITETLRELDMIFATEVGGQSQHLTNVIEEHLESLDDRSEVI